MLIFRNQIDQKIISVSWFVKLSINTDEFKNWHISQYHRASESAMMLSTFKIFVFLFLNKIVALHGIKNAKLELFPLPPLETTSRSIGTMVKQVSGVIIGTSTGIFAFRRLGIHKWMGRLGRQQATDNGVNISAVVAELKMEILKLKAELIVIQDRNNKSIVDSIKKTNEITSLRNQQEETDKNLKSIVAKVSRIQRDSRTELGIIRGEVKSLGESFTSETRTADTMHVNLRRELDDFKKETVGIITEQNNFFVNKIKNYTDSMCDIISESV